MTKRKTKVSMSFERAASPLLSLLSHTGHTLVQGSLSLFIMYFATRRSATANTIIITLTTISAPVGSAPGRSFMYFMKVGPVKKEELTPSICNAMYVPPVSLRDLAKQRMNPVTSPALKSGSVIVLTAVRREAPRVMPAVSKLGSIWSNMPASERTMYGNVNTVWSSITMR